MIYHKKPILRHWNVLLALSAISLPLAVYSPAQARSTDSVANYPTSPSLPYRPDHVAYDPDDYGYDAEREVIVRGTVRRVQPGTPQFDLRSDNGRTYVIVTHDIAVTQLTNGDRVEVRGYLDRNILVARRVTLLRSGGGYRDDGRFVTVRGTVNSNSGRDQFDLRADDGRFVRVISRNRLPQFSYGDRVEVQGRFNGTILMADTVRLLRSDDRDDRDYGYGYRRFDFPGTVVWVERLGIYRDSTRLRVRGDNGRTYTMEYRGRLSSGINSGDRVRVTGSVSSRGDLIADHVRLLDDRDGDGQRREVNFPGIVESVRQGDDFLYVRGDDGRLYLVRYHDANRFRRYERVRVIGTFDGRFVQATSIRRL